MKLCRFVLNDAPELARSGIYHDGKVYETDGEHAVGIHDPGKVSLLTPLGTPPAVRVFESFRKPDGEDGLTYRFQNVSGLSGPNGEIAAPLAAHTLDFDLHVVGVVADTAHAVEAYEAPSFVLGYALMIVLFDEDAADEERALGLPTGPSHDFGSALGPYLTTPEDLTEFTVGSDPTNFEWRCRIRVNDTEIAAPVLSQRYAYSDLLAFATRRRTVHPGEVLAWPKVPKPSLIESALGRNLLETDRIEATVDGLGTLVSRIA